MQGANSWGEETQHFHRKKKKRKALFKHKIFFYLSLKATHGHFCLFAFFFFLEGIYICTYLQPGCIYTVKNTVLETQSIEKKNFSKN